VDLWDKLREPQCDRCSLGMTTSIRCAIGSGKVPSDIMIIGEAIGKRNNIKIAFEKGSGVHLEEGMATIGLSRDDVFITNIIKCMLTEEQNENKSKSLSKPNIEKCRYFLNQEMELVKPKYVLLLGGVALRAILQKQGIMKHRGYSEKRDGVTYFATVHPSYLFQNPRYRPQFLEDLAIFKTIISGKFENEVIKNTIVTNENFQQLLEEVKDAKYIAFDLETEGLYPYLKEKNIVCAGISFEEDSSWTFVDLGLFSRFIKWCEEREKKFIGHNYKFDEEWLAVREIVQI